MDKQTLRDQALKHRANMRIESQDSDRIFQHLKPLIKKDLTIAAYWSIDKELDTQPIMDGIIATNATCALPCVTKNSKLLTFAKWAHNSEMEQGAFNIPEPADKTAVTPDIILVPLLAFDRKGHRIGYGGGYYDTTIAHLRKNKTPPLVIGLAYAHQACLFNLPTEDHDQALDIIATPERIHDFRD